MITAILAFFQAVPTIVGGLNAFFSAYYNAKTQIVTAQIGGDVEKAKAILAARVQDNQTKVSWLQVVASSPILAFVVFGFSFPFIFYINKVIVYDICLGLGSTPPLKYELLTQWGGVIIGGIFITAGGVGAVHAVVNRRAKAQ